MLMEEMDLSQAELARRVGISQPAIYSLINSNKGGSRYLHRIARELHTTPEYLTGETEDPHGDIPMAELTSEERNWLDWLRSAAPEDRKALVRLARTIATSAASPSVHGNQQTYRAVG